MPTPPALSVVVPCYNEEESIAELCRRVCAACRAVVRDDFELILVNDGSRDDTWSRMCAAAQSDPRVCCLDLTRNYGQQHAIAAGLSFCRGQRVLLLDADLQDPPELVDEMMRKMDEGFSVVYGQRQGRRGEGLFKRMSAACFYRVLCRLTDVDIPRDAGDFRLMARPVVDALNAMPEQHRFVRGMVAWVGFRQAAIRYQREARTAGGSHYPLWKMIALAADAITGFSVLPLRIISLVAVATFATSLLLMVYAFYGWARFDVVRGWTSLISVVLFLGSVQLLCLGIIGEYVARTFVESKHRPLYLIREVRSANGNPESGKLSPSALT
jgi:dolichol-phosphate mannosyltransferase